MKPIKQNMHKAFNTQENFKKTHIATNGGVSAKPKKDHAHQKHRKRTNGEIAGGSSSDETSEDTSDYMEGHDFPYAEEYEPVFALPDDSSSTLDPV